MRKYENLFGIDRYLDATVLLFYIFDLRDNFISHKLLNEYHEVTIFELYCVLMDTQHQDKILKYSGNVDRSRGKSIRSSMISYDTTLHTTRK